MSGIRVNCGICGHIFEAPDDLAGLIATCPECQTRLSVPIPPGRLQKKTGLQVKRDQVVSGGKRCPSCGAMMTVDSILCVQCGYNLETGRRAGEERRRSPVFQYLLWGAGLVILAGLARSLYNQRAGRAAGPEIIPPPARSEAAKPAAPAAAAVTSAQALAAGVATQAAAEAAAEQARQEEQKRQAELEQEYRAGLTRQIDRRYPPFAPGATSVLRRVNGLVHRGVYVGVQKDTVVIFADKQRVEVPLKALDQASRLRCDAAFRKQLIDYQVKKKMAASKPAPGS